MSERTRVTRLGELLRAARGALVLNQAGLAKPLYVSKRTLARWENGEATPTTAQGARLAHLLAAAGAPENLVLAIAEELGVPAPAVEEEEETVVNPPAAAGPTLAEPRPSPSPAQWDAEHQAMLDAVADERDVLPRHLRAFGAQLLLAVDRAGLSPRDAAALIVSRGEKKAGLDPAASTPRDS